MARLLAALVGIAIVILQIETGAFHTHAPVDGRAHEHQHGPAIHDHDDDHHEGLEAFPHLEETGSLPRVITIAVPAATLVAGVALFMVHVGELSRPVLVCVGQSPTVSTRNHDPPERAPQLLRGPPHILTA